ncbi:23S rRNA (adenine(2030)-N(6))-methyltransferase RlmJ [Marinobacter salinexigens]|uniref:Ribosomal RNA large subunit methyltransferase J n=1 Tax=Marinobacter salinexigens TaxID=2919747 RepID=A0A5B0VNI4_9GAMM|nr:23S rRNA (adenine(2030)-N(6))-methyltransferase RlmJ [Marinobacter salinexigens]KAA1176252.1 23S rRNA (adenine(2030)-N(6))-methyltransferase RlmJ [Marinobacter salinexigens]
MLSYLHAFHAGNVADVQKHAALTLTLSMMQAKASGIACFDTHAGSAVYDLNSDRARKTGESDTGIQALWMRRRDLVSEDWKPVLALLDQLNPKQDRLRVYPGSPSWFRHFLRTDDALTTFELHPSEGGRLSDWAAGQKIRVLQEDGLKGLLKQLPPRQPRLLTLVDPSYEIKSDYSDVADTVHKAWRKCRHGVYLIWYPILTSGLQQGLVSAIENSGITKVLRSEVSLKLPPERGMTGSGMLIVNPPWGFGDRLSAMMDDVSGAQCLNVKHRLDWLVPE